jgi:hypothetical protein
MGQHRRLLSVDAEMRIKSEICTDLTCSAVLLFILIAYGKEGACGIPILTWNIGFFIIMSFKSILKGFTIFFINNNPQAAQRYVILSTLASDVLLITWLIYGNLLFYS